MSLFGTVVRALASNAPIWPTFKSWHWSKWMAEFFAGSLLCSERFFFGYSILPLSSKPLFPNSISSRNQVDKEPLSGCASSNSLFNYLFTYFWHCLLHNEWILLSIDVWLNTTLAKPGFNIKQTHFTKVSRLKNRLTNSRTCTFWLHVSEKRVSTLYELLKNKMVVNYGCYLVY